MLNAFAQGPGTLPAPTPPSPSPRCSVVLFSFTWSPGAVHLVEILLVFPFCDIFLLMESREIAPNGLLFFALMMSWVYCLQVTSGYGYCLYGKR